MKSLREVSRLRRRRQVIISASLIVALLVLASVAGYLFFNKSLTENVAPTTHSAKKAEPYPTGLSSDILFSGNSFWGRNTNDWSMASPLKYRYPFSRLYEFHRDKYNAWISGLECPMKQSVHMTAAEQEVALQFNCRPEYTKYAAKYFTAFTLANNHTDNQGVDGFKETQKHLEENGIQYFGNYDPTKLSDVCEVIALPVTVELSDKTSKEAKLPVAMCGYHGVFQIPPEASAAVMKQYSPYMPVFAMPHMGAEYVPAPDEIKTTFYRSLIDDGADVVLGDHPHWVQSTESYKGHLIVYSMGNFMFDQQDTPEVVRSAAIHVRLDTKGVDKDALSAWLSIGETCVKYKDDCLNKIKQQNLKKLPITFKFGVVGTKDDNKITHPATPAETAGILQRLNWQATMNQLKQPYSSL